MSLYVITADGDTRRRGTAKDFFLVLLMVLTAGFSAFTTYYGFSFDFPFVIPAICCVIVGLGLMVFNWEIRERRIAGRSLTKPFLFFFLPIFFLSFASNTNAIYTFQIQSDIVGDTQEAAWEVFDRETGRVISRISQEETFQELADLQTTLQVARQNLSRQIQDEGNRGFGTLAQAHFGQVQEILGIQLTPLAAPSIEAPMPQQVEYAQRLDAFIEEQAATEFANHPAAPLYRFRTQIDELRATYEAGVAARDYDRNTTDMMARDLNSVAFQANQMWPDIVLDEIDTGSDEVGKFSYTWRNFSNFINIPAILFAIVLGAVLDLIAPLSSIVFYRYEESYK